MPIETHAGTLTHWVDVGEGPTALMLHCALGQVGAWLPLMGELKGRRLLAFDMPGHGQSGPWDPTRDNHTQTLEVAQSLLGRTGGPVDVIAHSYGATVALRLAQESPDLVRTLTLVDPVLFAAVRLADPVRFAAYEAELLAECASCPTENRERTAAQQFYARWGGERPWAELGSAHRRYILERMPMIRRSDPALVEDVFGIAARLAEIGCPTLLISGSETDPIVADIMNALVAGISGAQRMIIGGAGHMLPLTHPGAMAAATESFLAEVTGAAATVQPPSGSIR